MGGQRLSVGGDRGEAEGKGPEEPDPPQGASQQAAERAGEAGQQDPFEGAGARTFWFAEHVFGAQSNDMGGTLVRSIGLVRARARIGLKNLAYNMRRLVQLERLAAAAPT